MIFFKLIIRIKCSISWRTIFDTTNNKISNYQWTFISKDIEKNAICSTEWKHRLILVEMLISISVKSFLIVGSMPIRWTPRSLFTCLRWTFFSVETLRRIFSSQQFSISTNWKWKLLMKLKTFLKKNFVRCFSFFFF